MTVLIQIVVMVIWYLAFMRNAYERTKREWKDGVCYETYENYFEIKVWAFCLYIILMFIPIFGLGGVIAFTIISYTSDVYSSDRFMRWNIPGEKSIFGITLFKAKDIETNENDE